MLIRHIETELSSLEIFSLFKNRKYCFFLDSAMGAENLGRYSFIGFEPEILFQSKNGIVEIKGKQHNKIIKANPFYEIKKLMECYHSNYNGEIPFLGGAVGYFGYDMCHYLEKIPQAAIDDIEVPDCFFGIYDAAIVIDHLLGKVYAASAGLLNNANVWADMVGKTIQTATTNNTVEYICEDALLYDVADLLTANFAEAEYIKALHKIQDYITSGDVYQVNMSQRFTGTCKYSPFQLYGRLRAINPAPFACYMDFGAGHIISSSSERFVKIKNGKAQTRPIKGTRPRIGKEAEDAISREELLSSEKDKAELLMIVDLERNDLGKVCKIGSVKVTELFQLEEYATVYHLVSTIEGELQEGVHAVDCISALFPGGSITGAPKIRAMEIIDKLEPHQRNIYTGSIGYIGFNGNADFNIAIRTILQKGKKVVFQAGGGIVWDSDAQTEYEETLHKAKALIKALNSSI